MLYSMTEALYMHLTFISFKYILHIKTNQGNVIYGKNTDIKKATGQGCFCVHLC